MMGDSSNSIEIHHADIYQDNNLILSNVDFKLGKGELIYLIGRTGSGKSSFLKTLYGDILPQNITGNIVGFDLKTITRKEIPFLRRKLGIVFQDFQLLGDRTIYENLLFALKASGWEDIQKMNTQIAEVLEKVSLVSKGYKMPHQLSGGEQQRAGIARALLNNPELIIADEPTGNLDPETSVEIVKLLFEISKAGTSVIVATHDMNIIQKVPSRIVKCEGGKIFDFVEVAQL